MCVSLSLSLSLSKKDSVSPMAVHVEDLMLMDDIMCVTGQCGFFKKNLNLCFEI